MTSGRSGTEPDADLGPVISPKAKERINQLVDSGIREGAKCLLDGRGVKVPGYESGNFVGPTILADVKVRSAGRDGAERRAVRGRSGGEAGSEWNSSGRGGRCFGRSSPRVAGGGSGV